MVRTFLTILLLLSGILSFSQGVYFLHENCEPPLFADTLIPGFTWNIEDSVACAGFPGNHYLRAKIVPITKDSLMAIPIIPDSNCLSFYVEFDHICKVDPLDYAFIQYRTLPPDTIPWRNIPASCYQGGGQYGTGFGSMSYTAWKPAQSAAIPDSSWWKHEIFDITSLILNNGVNNPFYLRFLTVDAGLPGPNKNYGWLIDNISVTEFPITIGIPEAEDLSVTMYSENNHIFIQNTHYREVRIFDLTGKLVIHSSLSDGLNRIPLAQTGLFIVSLVNNGSRQCRKIIHMAQ